MVKLILCFLMSLFLITSCEEGKNKHQNLEKNSTEVIEGTEEDVVKTEIADSIIYATQFSKDGKDSSIFVLRYQYYVNPNTPVQDSINKRIMKNLISATEIEYHAPVKNAILNHTFFKKQLDYFYKMSVESYKDEFEYSEYPNLYGFEYSITIDTSFIGYNQLTIDGYSFTGGAHGNGYTSYDFLSNKTGEIITFKNLVKNEKAFNKIAETYFRKQNEIGLEDDLVELGFWFPNEKFGCNNNFRIKNDTLSFLYNSYEIACYAQGPSEIIIPLKKIENQLKIDRFKK